jgi:hypothetical protein
MYIMQTSKQMNYIIQTSKEIKYSIQMSKQVTTMQYIYPTGFQCFFKY